VVSQGGWCRVFGSRTLGVHEGQKEILACAHSHRDGDIVGVYTPGSQFARSIGVYLSIVLRREAILHGDSRPAVQGCPAKMQTEDALARCPMRQNDRQL
jgi:hypothetical protein